MRVAEVILPEIERIPTGYFSGGKSTLSNRGPRSNKIKLNPLPGGSRFQYYIHKKNERDVNVILFDPEMPAPDDANFFTYYIKNPIGILSLGLLRDFPFDSAYKVNWITVDEDYRGQGIAKSLYGIVLSIMGATLISDDSQTPGGRRNWISIYKVPGAEVKAYMLYHDNDLDQRIKNILKQAGAKPLGKNRYGQTFYSLPVRLRPGSQELALLTSKLKLYSNDWDDEHVGLYAQFKGSQG
jgi:GNAT superfamily N-acetyltransferase